MNINNIAKENVYLSIGGNIFDRYRQILNSQILISKYIGKILKVSSVYETPPWGFEAENNFYNRVILVKTHLLPYELLKKGMFIESILKRERTSEGYASRTADIDILFYGNRVINTSKLTVPHARLHLRRFVLLPLLELNPYFVHPLLNKNIGELFQECNDDSDCKKLV